MAEPGQIEIPGGDDLFYNKIVDRPLVTLGSGTATKTTNKLRENNDEGSPSDFFNVWPSRQSRTPLQTGL